MKQKVGQVTEEEKNEIKTLFERKNGLKELIMIAENNDTLYEKLIKDMSETSAKFEEWWMNMSDKYHWESTENGNWEIDFETGDIYLI